MPIRGNKILKEALKKLKKNILEHGIVSIGKTTFNESINGVIQAIKDVYEGKGMDEKRNRLAQAFEDARAKINERNYSAACQDIISACNGKHIVGTQAIIVSWCKDLPKAVQKEFKKIMPQDY